MKRKIRLLLLVTAVILLLQSTVLAYEVPTEFDGQTLEEVVLTYMEQRGLNGENFSLSYYNTVTGEAYAYNDTRMMVAGSTYKLPLNMYYYEMERDG